MSRLTRPGAALLLGLSLPGCMGGGGGDTRPFAELSGLAGYPLHLPDMPLHDPWIVADRDAGLYRLFTTNVPALTGDSRLGIMAYSSPDLRNWARPEVVFTLPEGTWANDGAWAPEVHRWKGRWYLFATFYNDGAPLPPVDGRYPVRRATLLASAPSPDGPFMLEHAGAPLADPALMSLDGTLYRAPDGRPWLVYAHEWVQVGDGTIEAIPLDEDLKRAGPAITLFHASDAAWVKRPAKPGDPANFVTDGPELFRSKSGELLMLWSSYDADGYVQAQARSLSGKLEGPWQQGAPLVRADSGHGMLFHRFDGQLMMVVHRPFQNARGKLYEMRDEGDRLRVVREATWLDGETHPTHP